MEFKLLEFDTPIVISRIANVHYFEFKNEYQTVDDSHNFCELLYVEKGSICVYADNYSGILSDNQMIIHCPGEIHSLRCNENISRFSFSICDVPKGAVIRFFISSVLGIS